MGPFSNVGRLLLKVCLVTLLLGRLFPFVLSILASRTKVICKLVRSFSPFKYFVGRAPHSFNYGGAVRSKTANIDRDIGWTGFERDWIQFVIALKREFFEAATARYNIEDGCAGCIMQS